MGYSIKSRIGELLAFTAIALMILVGVATYHLNHRRVEHLEQRQLELTLEVFKAEDEARPYRCVDLGPIHLEDLRISVAEARCHMWGVSREGDLQSIEQAEADLAAKSDELAAFEAETARFDAEERARIIAAKQRLIPLRQELASVTSQLGFP